MPAGDQKLAGRRKVRLWPPRRGTTCAPGLSGETLRDQAAPEVLKASTPAWVGTNSSLSPTAGTAKCSSAPVERVTVTAPVVGFIP